MATILTVEEAAAWKDSNLNWPYADVPQHNIWVLFDSHQALHAKALALTAGLRYALVEIHVSLGCDPTCEEKLHTLLNFHTTEDD